MRKFYIQVWIKWTIWLRKQGRCQLARIISIALNTNKPEIGNLLSYWLQTSASNWFGFKRLLRGLFNWAISNRWKYFLYLPSPFSFAHYKKRTQHVLSSYLLLTLDICTLNAEGPQYMEKMCNRNITSDTKVKKSWPFRNREKWKTVGNPFCLTSTEPDLLQSYYRTCSTFSFIIKISQKYTRYCLLVSWYNQRKVCTLILLIYKA